MPEWNSSKDHGYTSQPCGASSSPTSSSPFPTNFRNVTLSKAPLDLDEIFFARGLRDRTIGILEFDYISTSKPADKVKAISSYDLNALLITRQLEPLQSGLEIAINPSASERDDIKTKGLSMIKPGKRQKRKMPKTENLLVPLDTNSENYANCKKQVAILEKWVKKRKASSIFDVVSCNLSDYFAMMKQRIGITNTNINTNTNTNTNRFLVIA